MDVLTSAVPAHGAAAGEVPLVVDLDGTLLRTDSLIESIFVLLRQAPLDLLKLPGWIVQGPARFKHRLSERAIPDLDTLPYRTELIDYLEEQKQSGRFLVLATAADARLAQQLARKTGLFDLVVASDGKTNLSGRKKRDYLVERFGARGFDYLGNAARDYPVWHAAREALLVSPSGPLVRQVAATTPVSRIFDEPRAGWKDFLHALRIHHWIKNVLVFAPLAAAYRELRWDLLGRAALACLAFSLCASSVYLLNDLLDLPADRRHPSNKERKLACGRISPLHALQLAPVLLAAGLLLGSSLSGACLGILALYFLLMLAYSLGLKDVPLLDVLILSSGYALRVLAGGYAVDTPTSPWLLAFCLCLFFSLALSKRYAELMMNDGLMKARPDRTRGYQSSDKAVLLAQGIASAYLAVLILALYTISGIMKHLHARQGLFWVLCLLLFYWTNYLWLMTARGRMHHDQVVFIFKDRVSRILLLVMATVAALAL